MSRAPMLALLASALAVVACGAPPLEPLDGTTNSEMLKGGEWTLAVLAPEGAAPRRVEVVLSARFEDSHVGGRAGPNAFGGDYEADDEGRLEITRLISTLIGGSEAEAAGAILAVMAGANTFEVTPDRLRIRTVEGTILDFKR